jgi:hypothetical protein
MSWKRHVVTGVTLVIFGGGLTGANAQNTEMRQYEQLRKYLFAGASVTAVFTPDKCKSTGVGPTKVTPTSSGGIAIQDFMEIGGNTLAFANPHLTLRPTGEAVLELVQYRVHSTGTASVKVSFLSPTTYKPIQEAHTFECQLGLGLNFRHSDS